MRTLALLLLMTLSLAAQESEDVARPTTSGANKTSVQSSRPAPAAAPSSSAPAMKAPEAEPRASEPEEAKPSPPKPAEGVRCDWFGHAFIYLTSQSGVRVAIDPFGENSVKYAFPPRLDADVVLMSCESEDRSGGARLNGSPQLFRSLTAVGTNQANGILFQGIDSLRDASAGKVRNTIFVFDMDRLRFCHLGGLGGPLTSRQKSEIGRVDVLFLPIGNPGMRPSDWTRIIEDLKAKWVVPIAARTERNADYAGRSIDEFLSIGLPVKRTDANTVVFSKDRLPAEPTVLLLAEPGA
jgi:L-ascorbate metabolism protein UlaG (beta-lactamase superfamily)